MGAYENMHRLIDLFIASICLVISTPVIILVAIAIFLVMGRPVFFTQDRAGLNGKKFSIIKFRTMRDDADDTGKQLPDQIRITSLGRFLRATSLDELPELWNVIIGDMSMVGPRPLPMDYLPLYSSEQLRRHNTRPGITGWAQINGRNAVGWEDRFQLDLWYVENKSFFLDLLIIWKTISVLLNKEKVVQNGQISMSKFKGSNREGGHK